VSNAVLIIGDSGSGKSTSMRNLDPTKALLIQAVNKRLPFPRAPEWTIFDAESNTRGNVFQTDRTDTIVKILTKTQRDIVVIDDFQYIMANEFMRRSAEKGYEKFTEIGRHAWDIVMAANALLPTKRVYILAHTDVDDASGRVRMKTIGKMLNEKVTVEGLFTIVLRAQVRADEEDFDKRYVFSTQSNGFDPVKSPMGLFDSTFIPNDLAAVDARICEYYDIPRSA
jgi:hypothetical protein